MPVELVELRDVNKVPRAAGGLLHRAQINERTHHGPSLGSKVDDDGVLAQTSERRYCGHPVEYLNFTVTRSDLEGDRAGERSARERFIHRMLGSEVAQHPGQSVEVLGARLGDEVDVTGRAHNAVRRDSDSSDDHVIDAGSVERRDDPLRARTSAGSSVTRSA